MNTDMLKICKNYNSIVECEFLDEDTFSHKLVDYYKYYASTTDFNNPDSIKKIQNLDIALHRYVKDYKFSKKLRDTVDVSTVIAENFSYLNEFMDYIILFCNEYDQTTDDGVVVQTRWI